MSQIQHDLTAAEYPSGFLLLDATYTPVNHPHLSTRERDQMVLADFPLLVEELRKCRGPATKLVLVKANVCRLLDSKLIVAGFTVLNQGKTIPFPSTGQQRTFRQAVRHVLPWNFDTVTANRALHCLSTDAFHRRFVALGMIRALVR